MPSFQANWLTRLLFIQLAIILQSSPLQAEEKDIPTSVLAASIGGHVHPSIGQTKDGTLVVVYQGKNVLMCSRSTDDGQTWTQAKEIATTAIRPEGIRKPRRFEIYPGTVDVLPDDRVLLTWNYIADDKANDGYYERALLYSLSSDAGQTWSDQGIIGPVDGKHLGAVRHNVLAWHGDRWMLPLRVGPPRVFDPKSKQLETFPLIGPDKKQHEYQQIARTAKGSLLAMGPVLLHSNDNGKSWSEVADFPAIPDKRDNAEGRYLTTIADGRVLVTWGVGHQNKGLRYNLSSDDGRTWISTKTVILLPETDIAARYYSARTIQLDAKHVGTVYMNRRGVHFLKVKIDRF